MTNIVFRSRSLILPALGIILIISLISCGRRGDPFLSAPVEETVLEHESEKTMKQDITSGGEDPAEPEIPLVSSPDAPKGLVAVYTGAAVVITWDEITGQDVRMYRVYRMDGETYKVIGNSLTTAFTDKSIESNKVYHYRVSAVGLSESQTSEEISVVTEKK